MAVSQEKCIQCNGRYRGTGIENISPSESLASDGAFMRLPYWFCSTECYKKAVRKYLDPRYDFDSKAQDDEECLQRIQKALDDYREEATRGMLYSLLFHPFRTEDGYVQPQIDKAVEAFQNKKIAEISGAEIQLHNRLFAEWQHEIGEEKAEREKEAVKRTAQDEKLAKEQEARNVEEKKWRPRPFDI